MSNNYVINEDQINSIISTLDRIAKSEGLTLHGASSIIESVIKPLTSLQAITLNEPQVDQPLTEEVKGE